MITMSPGHPAFRNWEGEEESAKGYTDEEWLANRRKTNRVLETKRAEGVGVKEEGDWTVNATIRHEEQHEDENYH